MKLACLWSQLELCGRRPAKIDPVKWACKKKNFDSFSLFARLKRLPKVPTFAEAVMQQRLIYDDTASKNGGGTDCEGGLPGAMCYLDKPNEHALKADPSPAGNGNIHHCLFDDEEVPSLESDS